jgi:ubiquitin C-terminal hydrolase
MKTSNSGGGCYYDCTVHCLVSAFALVEHLGMCKLARLNVGQFYPKKDIVVTVPFFLTDNY